MANRKEILDPAEKAAVIAGQIIALGEAAREHQSASISLARLRHSAELVLSRHFEANVVSALVTAVCEPESLQVVAACIVCESVQLRTRMSREMCLSCAIADRDATEARANEAKDEVQ